MNISRVHTLTSIGHLSILLLLGLIALKVLFLGQQQIESGTKYILKAYQLADQLRQSSDDLTRMARTYVETGEPIYKEHYYHILAIRNGTVPRPEPYTTTFWQVMLEKDASLAAGIHTTKARPLFSLMQEMGLTGDELELLRLAQHRSDTLVQTEIRAFSTIESIRSPDARHQEEQKARALALLFDDTYHQQKREIMLPITTFVSMVEQRSIRDANHIQRRQALYIISGIGVIALAILIELLFVQYSRKRIIRPLNTLTETAAALSNGELDKRIHLGAGNELHFVAASLNRMADALSHKIETLEFLSRTDGLTGTLNRRAIIERLNDEMKRASRNQTPLSLLMMDIDHFKSINDRYGHPCGDSVLKAICRVIEQNIREIDSLGRLGGEEFIILLPGIGPAEAELVAERNRQAIEQMRFTHGQPAKITVSIGMASMGSSTATSDLLLQHADSALYGAKENGRNRVMSSH